MSIVRTAMVLAIGLASLTIIEEKALAANILVIFDASGSMNKRVATGETRLDLAKRSVTHTLSEMLPDTKLGLLFYGHRRAKDCSDIELVSPIGSRDASTIAANVAAVRALGETPIAQALLQGAKSFAALKGQTNRIVLVTDGIEECNGDPCAAAKAVRDAGLDLIVDVVGFALDDRQRKAISCVAETTGGRLYSAQDLSGLQVALTQAAHRATSGKIAKFYVRAFQTDDVARIWVSASDKPFYTSSHYNEDSGWMDITNYLKEGENPVRFQLENGPSGYVYGFQVKADDRVLFDEQCGSPGHGCNNDEQRSGIVYDRTIVIQK